MSEAKHNPLPWTAVLEEKFSDEIEIKAATGRVVAVIEYDDGYGQPDADLIIAAVNSHATMTADLARVTAERDRLRAACEAALSYGSHGDTEEGVSVSYMLANAIKPPT